MKHWRITKILNNNVVFVTDDQKREFIAVGNGLGFHHRVYENIYEHEIINIFAQVNNTKNNRLVTMLEEIPFDRIEMAVEMAEYSEKKLNRKMNENLILGLADHIHFTLQRYKDGMIFPAVASEEIKRFYQEEFQIGLYIIDRINERYNVKFNTDEASAIAFHIIQASSERKKSTIDILYGVRDVVQIVTEGLSIELDENSLDYSRFIIHLKFFLRKVVLNTVSQSDTDRTMLANFEVEFENIANIVESVNQYLVTKYDYQMNDDDKLYLFVHIRRLFKK